MQVRAPKLALTLEAVQLATLSGAAVMGTCAHAARRRV